MTQPEQLWYWDKIVTIRPNWEQEEIVNVPSKQETEKSVPPPIKETTTETDEIQETEKNPEQQKNNAMEEPYIKSGIITPKESN